MKATLKEDLIFSCYLSTIRRGNRVVVFHRLHPEFLNFSIKEWEEIKRLKNNINKDILKELLEKKLVINNRNIDRQELKLFEDSLNYDLNTLYLVLTRDCNLQCKYCMFSCLAKSERDKQLMSELIAKQGINLWRKLVKKFDPKQQYNIILYGGEPLLNMVVLKWSLEYIHKLQKENKLPVKNLQVLVDTNGVLLNQKIAELFKKHNVKVTVALDGVKKINDSYRVCNNKGTFENVLKGVKLLKKLGIITYVSTMAVPEYYNKKTVDEFCCFLSKYNIKLMGMNLPKGQESFLMWKLLKKERKQSRDDYQKKAVIFMINFWKQAKKLGVIECQINKKVESLFFHQGSQLDCGGFGSHIVIQPNGEIGSCPWSYKYNFGNVKDSSDDLFVKRNLFRNKYRKLIPLYNSKCLKCKAISICGGNCIWNLETLKNEKNVDFCDFNKILFENLVLDNLNVFKIYKDK